MTQALIRPDEEAIMRLIFLVLLALWLEPAVARADEPITLAKIRADGVLRVGTTGDYKPFTMLEADGSYEGADIVMSARLAEALGVKVTYVHTTWPTLTADFVAGKFDIAVVTVQPDRAKLGVFSISHFVDGKRPIARCADKDRFTSIEKIDQPDVRVITNPGASNEVFAEQNFPHAAVSVFSDNAKIFDEIVAGRADVMVTDGIEVDQQAILHPQLCAAAVPAAFTRLEKAYWLHDDPALVAAVNQWLSGEVKSGEWNKVLLAALHQQ
jgi:cyclohexadienyl dehydratase